MEANLFEIKLTQQGRNILVRLKSWAKFFYACTLATCLFDIINAFFVYRSYLRMSNQINGAMKIEMTVDITFLIIYGVLLIMMGSSFYLFTKKCRSALRFESEEGFNKSFKFLLRHVIIGCILFALNSVWAAVIAIGQFKLTQ